MAKVSFHASFYSPKRRHTFRSLGWKREPFANAIKNSRGGQGGIGPSDDPLEIRRVRGQMFRYLNDHTKIIIARTQDIFRFYFKEKDRVAKIRIKIFRLAKPPFGHLRIFVDYYPASDFHAFPHLLNSLLSGRRYSQGHRPRGHHLNPMNFLVSGDLSQELKNDIANILHPPGKEDRIENLMRELEKVANEQTRDSLDYYLFVRIPKARSQST